MRRREIILGLGCAAAWSRGAASQPTVPVVGILYSGSELGLRHRMIAFRQGLAELDFEDGRNIVHEYRWASDDHRRLPELAADLVRRRVAVVVCFGPAAALAAKSATADLPIIFVALADPVRLGLVNGLSHPGGNATGTASLVVELDAKRFELLHELVPGDRPIGLLVNPDRPDVESQIAEAVATAARLRRGLVIEKAGDADAIESAFASLARHGVAALVIGGDPLFAGHAERVVELARRLALPAVYQWREFVEVGGLMSYGPSRAESYRQAGVYVARVLRGARPSELPVMQPTRLEFVLNTRAARVLGLTIPAALLARADEVIE